MYSSMGPGSILKVVHNTMQLVIHVKVHLESWYVCLENWQSTVYCIGSWEWVSEWVWWGDGSTYNTYKSTDHVRLNSQYSLIMRRGGAKGHKSLNLSLHYIDTWQDLRQDTRRIRDVTPDQTFTTLNIHQLYETCLLWDGVQGAYQYG